MKKLFLSIFLIMGFSNFSYATSVNVKGDTIKIANDTENQTMWEDYEFGKPGVFVTYFNEFTDWVADSWTITEVGTNTQTLSDAANGILVLTTGGTENDGISMQLGGTGDGETSGESWLPTAGKDIYFETSLKITEVTQNDLFVGFHIQDTAITASEGANFIGFLKADGSTTLQFKSSVSSVDTQSTATTMVDDTYVKLGIKCVGVTNCKAYVDNVLVGTIYTASIPTTEMKLSVEVLAGDGNADVMSVDYIFAAQER